MNPARFFVEVLESHKFRRSDSSGDQKGNLYGGSRMLNVTSDNATLLDMTEIDKAGRLTFYLLAESAAKL